MFEILFLGGLLFLGAILLGALALVGHVIGFVITLPFRILGLLFHLVGFLIALPFLLLAGVLALVGVTVVGILTGGFLLLPLLPFVLVGAGLVWLFKRRPRSGAAGV